MSYILNLIKGGNNTDRILFYNVEKFPYFCGANIVCDLRYNTYPLTLKLQAKVDKDEIIKYLAYKLYIDYFSNEDTKVFICADRITGYISKLMEYLECYEGPEYINNNSGNKVRIYEVHYSKPLFTKFKKFIKDFEATYGLKTEWN